MSIAVRLGLATRGLRGGFGETVIVEVPVEVPFNYYVHEELELDELTLTIALAEDKILVQEILVDTTVSITDVDVQVSSIEVSGAY